MTFALDRKTKASSILTDKQNRAVGAYLGLAIGDALGATTEFMTPAEIREYYGTHDQIRGGGWLKLKPGQVTDDTEMSLALGNSLLQHQGVDASAIAQAYSDWMKSKPVDIGNTVRRGLIHYRQTGETEVPVNEHDAGNGACMRSLPIALFYHNHSSQQWQEASRLQSHITHNNPVADAGTETLLAMVIAALKGKRKNDIQYFTEELIRQFPAYAFDRRPMKNPSGWIVETLQAVWQAFFSHDDFEATLIDVVNRGGDADTTGAIAGMLCGAYYGEHTIPNRWIRALDQQVQNQCKHQALALIDKTS